MSMQLTKNFNSSEFDSPDIPDSGMLINRDLVNKLQKMRNLYGKPIIIISGVRSIKRNKKVHGVVNSSHVANAAVDILAENSKDMFRLVKLALTLDFVRVGINFNSIHLDLSANKPQNVMWTYY